MRSDQTPDLWRSVRRKPDPGARHAGSSGDEMRPDDAPAKQTTRLIKVACPTCAYPARVTRVWIERLGPPSCPCGERMRIDDTNPLADVLKTHDAAATGSRVPTRSRGPR